MLTYTFWSAFALQHGLHYICATAERFFAVGAVLGNMVTTLPDQPSHRLLKHIIRCYLRLSENGRWVRMRIRIRVDYYLERRGEPA